MGLSRATNRKLSKAKRAAEADHRPTDDTLEAPSGDREESVEARHWDETVAPCPALAYGHFALMQAFRLRALAPHAVRE